MISFGNIKANKTTKDFDPISIFKRQPKPAYMNDLFMTQAEVLRTWFQKRNDCLDTVIKMNTGSGKTIVGLLIALSSVLELQKCALYLVESKQLASQVANQASDIGIKTEIYNGRSSLHKINAKETPILIATYQALFNGKTVFGLDGQDSSKDFGTIIVDDAHASFSTINDGFTLKIHAEDSIELYKNLCNVFEEDFIACERQATFDDFLNGVQTSSSDFLEVPFWAWVDKCQRVYSMIADASREELVEAGCKTYESLKFSWPLIMNGLKYCRGVITREGFYIVPYIPDLSRFTTYAKARRRVYMSATFADNSSLIRTYGLKKPEELHTITSSSTVGAGRKMVLFQEKDDESLTCLLDVMRKQAEDNNGVMVLAANDAIAARWGEQDVEWPRGEEITAFIEQVRDNPRKTPFVLSNRYNGIDLPNESCRLLILDGLPQGISIYDKVNAKVFSSSHLTNNLMAQRIEQGFGRGTRGSGDYCVVVLIGDKLCSWVKDGDNLSLLTLTTQAQIQFGVELQNQVKTRSDFLEALCLGVNNDQGFSEALSSFVEDYVQQVDEASHDELNTFAEGETKIIRSWRKGEEDKAHRKVNELIRREDLDAALRSYLLQLDAHIYYTENKLKEAFRQYRRAYALNDNLTKPKVFSGITICIQAERIFNRYESGEYSIFLERYKKVDLAELEAKSFERYLETLGYLLGFESKREDIHGKGPDVVWLDHENKCGIAFEAKSCKKEENLFKKSEHGQLLVAEKWLNQQYPDYRPYPISIHPNNYAEDNANAQTSLVITLEKLMDLHKTVLGLEQCLSCNSYTSIEKKIHCEEYITNNNLALGEIVNKYAVHFRLKG